jgi:type II secretory pathway pseudopilin PulG
MSEPRATSSRQRRAARTRGVILLALLIGLALSGIALMAAVDVWTLARQREREQQLLFVGDQYRQAIQRYWFAAPSGSPRLLPASLEALLEDERYPMPVRHLRRLYPDPITGKSEWGVLRQGDRIAGVYSLSEVQPVKQAGFSPAYELFNGKTRYRDWEFVFTVPRRTGATLPSAAGTPASGTPSLSTRPVRGNLP